MTHHGKHLMYLFARQTLLWIFTEVIRGQLLGVCCGIRRAKLQAHCPRQRQLEKVSDYSSSSGRAFVLSACELQASYETLLPASCLQMNRICSTETQSSCQYDCLYICSVCSKIFQLNFSFCSSKQESPYTNLLILY